MQSIQYQDMHQPHAASSGPSSLSHYQYQQPSALQPQHSTYGTQHNSYSTPAYYQGGISPSSATHPPSSMANMLPGQVAQPLQLPAMSSGPASAGAPGSQYAGQQAPYDTTGQVAPPGMKPRVTATLWEDEGSLCFQVEAKGVCVARREDNHMINGTKLLNVAGMTRGRRDGILKSEKVRHVVKIGPMHLKGVWIPFERALDFANREKITDLLYPLFVHDIGALLYHPSNQNGRHGPANATMAAVDRRRSDQPQRYPPSVSQPPSSLHHHSMSNPVAGQVSQPPHSMAPHPSSGRPGLDRAHTFPTPPTSASSLIGMNSSGSYDSWSGNGVSNMHSSQPLSIDTGLSNTRSVPTTPATTPPGSMQNMPQYQTSQGYDSSRQVYNSQSTPQSQYNPQPNMMRYGQPLQPSPYPKTEMAPPSRAGEDDGAPADAKPAPGIDHGSHGPGAEDQGDHQHEPEYTHSNSAYPSSRTSYGYNTASAPPPMHGEHAHLSPEMTSSPHQNGSGHATPRTTASQQWSSTYATPQRSQQAPASNLYSVMSDPRASGANGASASDGYSAPGSMQTGYGSQPYTNGTPTSTKRMREDDDEQDPAGKRRSIRGGVSAAPWAAPNLAETQAVR